jgi:hypothetical protein
MHQFLSRFFNVFSTSGSQPTDPDQARTLHNERVKLNASFYNSLAVWFAGAGSVGGIVTTSLAQVHNFPGAVEIASGGFVIAFVLRRIALREIGKLK